MAQNADGTVTTKTTGKVATTPSGTGTAVVRTTAAKANPVNSPKVVPNTRKTAVAKSARAR